MKPYKKPNGFSCGVRQNKLTAQLNGGFDFLKALYQRGYADAVEQMTDALNEQAGRTMVLCGWQQAKADEELRVTTEYLAERTAHIEEGKE